MSTNKGYSLRIEQLPGVDCFFAGGVRRFAIAVTNLTTAAWSVAPGPNRVIIKAAWFAEESGVSGDSKPVPLTKPLGPGGSSVEKDAIMTPLTKPLGPGESSVEKAAIMTPPQAGRYRLSLELVARDKQLQEQLVGVPLELDVTVESPDELMAGSIQPLLTPGMGGVSGRKIEIPVRVINRSEAVWPAKGGEAVRLAYHWRDAGRVVIWDGVRTHLPEDLPAGGSVLMQMAVQMPDAPGKYQLQLTIVCEQWGWFENYSSCFSSAQIEMQCIDPARVDEQLALELEEWPKAVWRTLNREQLLDWKEKVFNVSQQDLARIGAQIKQWQAKPVFSIIMPVFNPPILFLRDALESVLGQLYPHWELCIADDASTDPNVRAVLEEYRERDGRIRVTYRSQNGHICAASNSALAMATGDYVLLLDHDDRLVPLALYCYAGEIIKNPEVQWLYSDLEVIDEDNQPLHLVLQQPPDIEFFRSRNYMGAHAVYRSDVISATGGFREGYEGSQDYDLGLRTLDRVPLSSIRHLPFPLYQWRRFEGSASSGVMSTKPYAITATQRSIADYLARNGIEAGIKQTRYMNFFEVRYRVPEPAPLVTIIVPTRNRFDLLRPCIHSILSCTNYRNYELLIADNESTDPETLGFLRYLRETGLARVLSCPGEFNYSAIINRAVADARGEIVCLLNNDTEAIHEEWLTILAGLALQPGIGVVGPMLLYDNYTVQHGGVIFDGSFTPRHCFRGVSPIKPGSKNLVMFPRAVPALTGACQTMRKQLFNDVGGMEDLHLKIAFSDIDLCLKVLEAGYRNVYTPFVRLFHWESASRGSKAERVSAEDQTRARRESAFLQHNWITRIQTVDAGNPNQSEHGERMSLPRQTLGQMIRKYDVPARPQLAFLHIPKTAGCSFRDWVRSHLSEREVAVLDGATNLGCYDGSKKHVKRAIDSLKRSRAIYSHFTYGLHEKVGQPLCYATLIRDAVSRVWSTWNYLRQMQMSPLYGIEANDIGPFIRKRILSGNHMTRMLAGERPEPLTLEAIIQGPCWQALGFVGFNFPSSLWTGGVEAALQMPDTEPDNDPRLLERAMGNLDRFFFVGRVEALDQAAEALAAALDWNPGHPIPYINEGKGDGCKERPGGPQRELIEEYNQLDIQLYQYVSTRPNGYILHQANRDG